MRIWSGASPGGAAIPYAVYFREVGYQILVLAIHGRQDPRRWQDRT